MSSEIYRRSLGYTVNEDALRREVENGVGTGVVELTLDSEQPGADLVIHDRIQPTTKVEMLEREIEEWEVFEALNGDLNDYARGEVVQLHAELVVEREAELMELSKEHPIYTGLVAGILKQKLDELHHEGHPVDAEMYVEATELAEAIVAANPVKEPQELVAVAETMVAMVQAEYQLRQLTLAA